MYTTPGTAHRDRDAARLFYYVLGDIRREPTCRITRRFGNAPTAGLRPSDAYGRQRRGRLRGQTVYPGEFPVVRAPAYADGLGRVHTYRDVVIGYIC